MLFEKIPTPCIGICSTTYGDEVCRGCRRYLHEVINWNRYNDTEKKLIWLRLDQLLEQVLPSHFHINNAAQLSERLKHYRIPHRPDSSAWGQLQSLLKATAKQQPNLQEFGITRIDKSALNLRELHEKLQADMHQLAAAYYEKDFLRAARHAAVSSIPLHKIE